MPDEDGNIGVDDVAAVYGHTMIAPFQTWLAVVLAECSKCSALIQNQPDSMRNHERWHAQFDGRPNA